MMKAIFCFSIGFGGLLHTEIVDVPDYSTEDDIESMWEDWVWNQIDGYWETEERSGK